MATTKDSQICGALLESKREPGHTHLCQDHPHYGSHWCAECRTWFGSTRKA